MTEFKQIEIAKSELLAFTRDESGGSFAVMLTPSAGEPFMITMSRSVAAEMGVRIVEAIQQQQREGVPPPKVKVSPERVLAFQATAVTSQPEGDLVLVHMEGDRSQPYVGLMKPLDARRFGAKLMAESDGGRRPGPAN